MPRSGAIDEIKHPDGSKRGHVVAVADIVLGGIPPAQLMLAFLPGQQLEM